MSWIEAYKDDMIIITGDGKRYQPLYIRCRKATDYNISEFTFPKVKGSLVDRGTPRGRRIPLEFYFNTLDHLDVVDDFEKSAADPRAWTIIHPMYGRLLVQPVSLEYDNEHPNLTRVTGSCIETITEQYPKGQVDTVARIESLQANTVIALETAYANRPAPSIGDKVPMRAMVVKVNSNGLKFTNALSAPSYYNSFTNALNAIDSVTATPIDVIRKVNNLMLEPMRFNSSVRERLNIMDRQIVAVQGMLVGAPSFAIRSFYEDTMGVILSAICFIAGTPRKGDYARRSDTLGVIERILGAHNIYIATLGTLQSTNGAIPNGYMPDSNALAILWSMVNFTVSNLMQIAIGGKQERTSRLMEDTNWIELTHKYYGLDPQDENIVALISQNEGGIKNMLGLSIGDRFTYYV